MEKTLSFQNSWRYLQESVGSSKGEVLDSRWELKEEKQLLSGCIVRGSLMAVLWFSLCVSRVLYQSGFQQKTDGTNQILSRGLYKGTLSKAVGRAGDSIRVVQHSRASNNRAVTNLIQRIQEKVCLLSHAKRSPPSPRGLYRSGPWGIKILTSLSFFPLASCYGSQCPHITGSWRTKGQAS